MPVALRLKGLPTTNDPAYYAKTKTKFYDIVLQMNIAIKPEKKAMFDKFS